MLSTFRHGSYFANAGYGLAAMVAERGSEHRCLLYKMPNKATKSLHRSKSFFELERSWLKCSSTLVVTRQLLH